MGSKSAQAAREAMAARVQNGELTASQAYALDKSGAFSKGYFEPYQEIAARSKAGVWRNAPTAERKNAASYTPTTDTPSKVTQRAIAAGIDPFGYDGTTSKNAMVEATKPSGFNLAFADERKALETKRDILTRDLNATNNVALKNKYAAEIEAINDTINKTYYDNSPAVPSQEAGVANFGFKNTSAGTGLPAPTNTYSADVQKLESEIDSLQQMAKQYKGTSAESGYVAKIGTLAMKVAEMTAQQDPKKSAIYQQLHSDAITGNRGSSSYVYDDPYDYGENLDKMYGQGLNSDREFGATDQRGAQMKADEKLAVDRLVAGGLTLAAATAIVAAGGAPAALLGGGGSVAAPAAAAAGAAALPAATGAAGASAVVPVAAAAGGAGVLGTAGAVAAGAAGGKVVEKVVDSVTGNVVDKVIDKAVDTGTDKFTDPAFWASLAAGGYGAITAANAGKEQADAARYAADKQFEASNKVIDLQKSQYDASMARDRELYDQQRQDTQAWRTAGEQSLGELGSFDQNNPNFQMPEFDFQMEPGSAQDKAYAWRLSEGMKTLENSAAAKGMLRSGNTLKAVTEFGQGMASQERQNAFNNYMTTRTNAFNEHNINRGQNLGRLQSLAGLGQTGVSQLNNAGQNYGNNASAAGQAYANNTGNEMIAGANALGQGRQGVADGTSSGNVGAANALTNALSGYLQYDSRNRMNNRTYGGY